MIREVFESTPGVVDVDWFVEDPQPKRVFRVDREKAALQGVPAAQVARTLRLALAGEDACLLHDPADVPERRWKLFTQRYLSMEPHGIEERLGLNAINIER